MTTPKGTQSGDYELSLILDGLYYAEAKQTCSGLADADAQYAHTESRLKEINAEILEIEGQYKRREDAYDETESLCIQSEGWWNEYQKSAAKLIRGTATVHTLCANCLEAHINIIAQTSLSGAKFSEFDKLALYGKWLFYPQITQIGAFDVGREPIQGLSQLISARNALVHFKGIRCRREFGFQVPDFVERLRLRIAAAEKSLQTVHDLVSQLAAMEKREEPEWLRDRWDRAFLTVTPAFRF
jgi:hypothetical protein